MLYKQLTLNTQVASLLYAVTANIKCSTHKDLKIVTTKVYTKLILKTRKNTLNTTKRTKINKKEQITSYNNQRGSLAYKFT